VGGVFMRKARGVATVQGSVVVWGLSVLAWAVAVWGVWVPGHAVGTQVLGVDMAEAVKFLPAVRGGQIPIWREGFLLPQCTLSFLLSVHAWRRRWPFSTWVRFLLMVLAMAVALSMLPPAWSPATLRSPEWRLQVAFILVALGGAILSPLWRYFPVWVGNTVVLVCGLGTGVVLLRQLPRVWPEFEHVYHTHLPYGPGVGAVVVGILGLIVLTWATWASSSASAAREMK